MSRSPGVARSSAVIFTNKWSSPACPSHKGHLADALAPLPYSAQYETVFRAEQANIRQDHAFCSPEDRAIVMTIRASPKSGHYEDHGCSSIPISGRNAVLLQHITQLFVAPEHGTQTLPQRNRRLPRKNVPRLCYKRSIVL